MPTQFNNGCKCIIPNGGFCPRHKVEKTARDVWLCQNKPHYWRAWEGGPLQHRTTVAVHPSIPRPGAELQKIIAWWQKRFPWFDLSEHKDCTCASVSKWMNTLGPDGCEKKIEQILDRLEAEAKKRKLTIPFQRTWARMMVKSAIRRSRKNQLH